MVKKLPELEHKSGLRMPAEKVVDLYRLFENSGVEVWIDGGWGVDALLEEQTREHADLDIAVDHKDENRLKEVLDERGYKVVQTSDKTEWVYVLGDGHHEIDVHVFGFDEDGNNTYGTGKINSTVVRCINPEWAIQFKSHPNQSKVDRHDQASLCEKFGLPVPPLYKP
jgi:lincosamide nucleotidyltransferase A/C/D/E